MTDQPATPPPDPGPEKQWGDEPDGGIRPWWKHPWTIALVIVVVAVLVAVAVWSG